MRQGVRRAVLRHRQWRSSAQNRSNPGWQTDEHTSGRSDLAAAKHSGEGGEDLRWLGSGDLLRCPGRAWRRRGQMDTERKNPADDGGNSLVGQHNNFFRFEDFQDVESTQFMRSPQAPMLKMESMLHQIKVAIILKIKYTMEMKVLKAF